MLQTTETLLEKGFGDQVFKEWNFASIFDGSRARCYALMNKAIKKNEISRLYRGTYVLGTKYRSKDMNKFFIANRMIPGSIISFETALAFHGWIPEKVQLIMSTIATGRSRSIVTPMGEFQYKKVPSKPYEFLRGVLRRETNNKSYLIASPLRALADYVYIKRIHWMGLEYLLDGLRIEEQDLETLRAENFDELFCVYSSKRLLFFLKQLQSALGK